jgi:WD40 repeat protein
MIKVNTFSFSKSRERLLSSQNSVIHVSSPPLSLVDCTRKIWDAETGKLEQSLKGHTKAVTNIAFDPRGESLGVYAPLHSL